MKRLMSRRTMVGLIVAVFASACGKSTPTSPSNSNSGSTISQNQSPSVPSAPAPVATGAQIVGSVSANAVTGAAGFRALSTGLTVGIVGTSISALVDASGHFELNDVPEGDVELHFSGPGVDANLPVAGVTANEHINLAVTVNGSAATVENTQRAKSDSTVSLDGIIASIDTSAVTLHIGGATIVASSSTSIQRGTGSVAFSDLRVGDKVTVQGTQDGSIVRAVRIDAEPLATVTGTVSGLAGACPSLTFSLDGAAVATDSMTSYGGGSACSDVKNGDKRVAIGPKADDGHVRALYVTGAEKVTPPAPAPPAPTPPPTPEVSITGIVGGLTGVCPNLSFTLDGSPVVTSASTAYGGGGACADVKNGDKRSAGGTKTDGRLIVKYISGVYPPAPAPTPTPAPTTDVTVTGIIANLAGACPSLTFTVNGYSAATSASTTYGGGSACATVKNGDKRAGVGTKSGDLLLLRYLTGASQ